MSQSSLNLANKAAGPVECLGQKFPSDEARREHYLKLLAQKLKDPEFRKIEGFPLGKDEDILALSDPPYYTACPNPWLSEFIQRQGKPFDPKRPYHREPFAADVSEGKNHPIYSAHSYHTKVPHRAIMRYLLHYTQPGDVVFDGFCGTGMTGVAAQLCGDRAEVQALRYRVQDDGTILNEEGKPFSKLGARHAILIDLSPVATFIAYNYNTPVNADAFEREARRILKEVEDEYGWMYVTLHGATDEETELTAKALAKCKSEEECQLLLKDCDAFKARIGIPTAKFSFGRCNYNVWSDVFTCPECAGEINFVSEALDIVTKRVKETLHCPHCHAVLTKRNMERGAERYYDATLKTTVNRAKQELALINYHTGKANHEKVADKFDLTLSAKTSEFEPQHRYPALRMPEGDESRRNDPIGLTHVHQYYRPRALCTLSAAYAQAQRASEDIKRYLIFTIEQTVLGMSKIARYAPTHYSQVNQYLSGTLYVGSQVVDVSLDYILEGKIKNLARILRSTSGQQSCLVDTRSSSAIEEIADGVLDYIFVDPPFGGNLTYSALNFLWEAWLGVLTNSTPEAITNQLAGKGLREYQSLMASCFEEFFRLLKPGRWITIEFSNTQASVWNTIQTTLQEAGFVVANVSVLDKQQGSFKAVTTTTAVKQDLVISAYKPNGGLEERFAKRGETEEAVWDFVQTHLRNLPVVKPRGGQLEFVAERDPRILYDRMVAFYVGHSTLVPLSSAEFQSGLAEKFPERDGMFFLPEQVSEYDKKRAQMENIGQLTVFVEDERSAINWLRNFLKDRPSTYQDINPDFMQQLSASWKKWESRPELKTLLDQNFLCYDGTNDVPSQIHGYLSRAFKELRNRPKDHANLMVKAKNRWYVPDPKKNVDVEALRNKRLLEEFWTYLPDGYTAPTLTANKGQTLPGLKAPRFKIPKGKKLKELRTEAVRVGFKHCYQQKDYTTILVVAEMLPESVLNEDEQLQMIYDTAVTRTSGE